MCGEETNQHEKNTKLGMMEDGSRGRRTDDAADQIILVFRQATRLQVLSTARPHHAPTRLNTSWTSPVRLKDPGSRSQRWFVLDNDLLSLFKLLTRLENGKEMP